MKRTDVYAIIDSERDYQELRWGGTTSSQGTSRGAMDRTLDEFILYIHGYATQLAQIGSTTDDPKVKLDHVRKVAGLCVAAMEAHGGYKREIKL